MQNKFTDWGLVILVNFMWATQVPVIRMIGERLSPVAVAFVPLLLSTLIFLPFLIVENRKRKVKMRWRWREVKDFVIPGLIGVFLMQYLYTVGSRMTLAANAGIITLTIPVLVAIFASIMLRESLNIVRLISFVLAIAGVLLTSLSDISGSKLSTGQYFAGNGIFLLACGCCAFYNVYCKKLVGKNYTEMEILVYGSIAGSIACIPVLIWIEPLNLREFFNSGAIAIGGILELSIIVYGLSMLLFFYILKRMDVTQAIMGNYLLPFFIALMGIVILNEKITLAMILGGGLVLASTLMITIYENTILEYRRNRKLSNVAKKLKTE